MRNTSRLKLALYDPSDTMNITGSSNSLNHNMELIDAKMADVDQAKTDIATIRQQIASGGTGASSNIIVVEGEGTVTTDTKLLISSGQQVELVTEDELNTVKEDLSQLNSKIVQAVNDYLANNPVSGVTPEQIASAIEAYLTEHPVEGGVTEEYLGQAIELAMQNAMRTIQSQFYNKTESDERYALKDEGGSGGAVSDVQLDGKSILSDGVATIPLASTSGAGAVKIGSAYGLYSTNGYITTAPANADRIDKRNDKSTNSNYAPVTVSGLDYAVKASLTDGKATAWTDEEKASAREFLGIDGTGASVDAYTKSESDARYASKSDVTAHLTKANISSMGFAQLSDISPQTVNYSSNTTVISAPKYASTADDMTDTDAIYYMGGYLYGYGSGAGGGTGYINQIPVSTDASGDVYNVTGYKYPARLSSSGESTLKTPTAPNVPFITGFIPCNTGDVIRLKNCFIDNNYSSTNVSDTASPYGQGIGGLRCYAYTTAKVSIGSDTWQQFGTCFSNIKKNSSGMVEEFTVASSDCEYIRLTLSPTGEVSDAIVTVNEEITEGSGDSGASWVQIGQYASQPLTDADYTQIANKLMSMLDISRFELDGSINIGRYSLRYDDADFEAITSGVK